MTTGYLDLSWLQRDRSPIVVKEAKEIEKEARKNRRWFRPIRMIKRLWRGK